MGVLADISEQADIRIMRREAEERLTKLADSLEKALTEFRKNHDVGSRSWLASIEAFEENSGEIFPLDNHMIEVLIELIRK